MKWKLRQKGKLKNDPKCFRGGLEKWSVWPTDLKNDQTCSTQKNAKYDEKRAFFFIVERNNIKSKQECLPRVAHKMQKLDRVESKANKNHFQRNFALVLIDSILCAHIAYNLFIHSFKRHWDGFWIGIVMKKIS